MVRWYRQHEVGMSLNAALFETMTVQYSLQAATATAGTFIHVTFFRWRGSVWSLIWPELSFWVLASLSLMILHTLIIGSTNPKSYYCEAVNHLIKLDIKNHVTILLSFTTVTSLTRWMDVYQLLVWPDNAAIMFNAHVKLDHMRPEEANRLRSTVARYLMMSLTLLLRDVSPSIRKRFPTLQHLTNESMGMATEEDIRLLKRSGLHESSCHNWVPLVWIATLLKSMRKTKVIDDSSQTDVQDQNPMDDFQYLAYVKELGRVRGMLGDVLSYDWVPMPLAMTQGVTFAVYGIYFLSLFSSQQPLCQGKDTFQFYEFVAALLCHFIQVFFYLGWLHCTQVVLNPFGDDDDDFEVNWLIQRHWAMLPEVLTKPLRAPLANRAAARRRWQLPHTISSMLISGAEVNDHPMMGGAVTRRRKERGG